MKAYYDGGAVKIEGSERLSSIFAPPDLYGEGVMFLTLEEARRIRNALAGGTE